jgi:glycerophosphoryl diester phosphodiesterase
MNSDRHVLAIALAALATAGCPERQSPKPPTFPGGGLLGLSTPLPQPDLLGALDGVYATSGRFGDSVVVHASTWGSPDDEIQASLAILANDHFAFALMQPGCLTDRTTSPPTTRLVLEGYWRYLDDPDPSPSTTGLVRLFVQPDSVAEALCQGLVPPAGPPVALGGATGHGENAPGDPLGLTWVQARKSRLGTNGRKAFLVGAHHGGCQSADNCGVSENTPETFVLAKQLGADYLEVDVRLTADSVPVFFHLGLTPGAVQGVYCSGSVEDFTYAQLVANCRLRAGEIIPRAVDALEYGLTRTDLGVWLDMKTANGVVPTSQLLGQLSQRLVPCAPGTPAPPGQRCLFPGSRPVMDRVIMGLPASDVIEAYRAAQQATDPAQQLAPGQLCLVEQDAALLDSIPCVAWSPRYTRGPMAGTVQQVQAQGKFAGYWTINDPTTIDAFLTASAPNGILTNYLGLLNHRWEAVGLLPPYPLGIP